MHFSYMIKVAIKRFCKNLDVRLVLTSFKVGDLFNENNPVPGSLKTQILSKFILCGMLSWSF